MRHAAQFKAEPTVEDERISRSMGILNSVAHPIWMVGALNALPGPGIYLGEILTFAATVVFSVREATRNEKEVVASDSPNTIEVGDERSNPGLMQSDLPP